MSLRSKLEQGTPSASAARCTPGSQLRFRTLTRRVRPSAASMRYPRYGLKSWNSPSTTLRFSSGLTMLNISVISASVVGRCPRLAARCVIASRTIAVVGAPELIEAPAPSQKVIGSPVPPVAWESLSRR